MEENNMEQAMMRWLADEIKIYCNSNNMIETYWDYQDRDALEDEVKKYADGFEGGNLTEYIADQMRDESWYFEWCDEYEDELFNGVKLDAEKIEDEALKSYVVDKIENLDYSDLRDLLYQAGYNGVDDGIEEELGDVKINVNLTLATDEERNNDMGSIILCFGTDYLPVSFNCLDAINLDNALTYLIHQQGHTLKEFYDCLLGDKDGGKFLNSLVREIENDPAEATCGLTVLVSVSVNEYGALLSKDGSIEVSTDTEVGIYNSWIGSGSLFEIELEKPFVFPASMVFHADLDDVTGTGNYSVGDCYGTMGEDRKGTVTKGGEVSVQNEDLDAVADYVIATYDNEEEIEESKNVNNKLTLIQEEFDDEDDEDDEDEDDEEDREDIDFNNLTKEQLWELREEIVLGSLYINDYENSFGIDPEDVCGFFDSFIEDMSQDDDGEYNDADIEDFDNPDDLYNYYSNCEYPFGYLEESKKVTEDTEYVSMYDELDDLLDRFASTDEQKVELYNAFNETEMTEFNEDVYDNWLDEMTHHNYRELRDYLDDLADTDDWQFSKITEGLRQDTKDAIDLAINEIDNGNSDDPDWFNEKYDTYGKLVQGVLDLMGANIKYGSGVEKEPTSAVNFSGKDEIIKEIKKQLAEWGYEESNFGKKTEDIFFMGDMSDAFDTENLINKIIYRVSYDDGSVDDYYFEDDALLDANNNLPGVTRVDKISIDWETKEETLVKNIYTKNEEADDITEITDEE